MLAGIRPPASVAPLLHPALADKFRRLARPLGHGRVDVTRSIIQASYPRIDISAAVRIGDRTHPVALGVNVTSGRPVIDTVLSPRLRLTATGRPPLGAARVALSDHHRTYSPTTGAGHVAQR